MYFLEDIQMGETDKHNDKRALCYIKDEPITDY